MNDDADGGVADDCGYDDDAYDHHDDDGGDGGDGDGE